MEGGVCAVRYFGLGSNQLMCPHLLFVERGPPRSDGWFGGSDYESVSRWGGQREMMHVLQSFLVFIWNLQFSSPLAHRRSGI